MTDCVINNLELGLCCINTELRKKKPTVFVNRTCRLKTVQEKGIEHAKSLALQNLEDALVLLDWCYEHGIKSYRMSSDMFPHAGNPRIGDSSNPTGPRYSLDFARDLLHQIGVHAKEYGIRLSFHPGQYNQVAAKTEKVFNNTVLDLSMHAHILDIIEEELDMGENRAILCIHGGGMYGDKKATSERWIEKFKKLPENVRSRIAIENCEKCYNSEDCLYIANSCGIPHIFDTHHYSCYTLLHPDEKQKPPEELIPQVLETWKKRGLKPYFHISQQGSGRTGHHSDFITEIPQYMLDIPVRVTMDVEAKAKEQAILKLVQIYNKK